MNIGSVNWNRLLADGTEAVGINLEKERIKKLAVYGNELLKWEKTTNLTSITDPFEVAEKHFLLIQ